MPTERKHAQLNWKHVSVHCHVVDLLLFVLLDHPIATDDDDVLLGEDELPSDEREINAISEELSTHSREDASDLSGDNNSEDMAATDYNTLLPFLRTITVEPKVGLSSTVPRTISPLPQLRKCEESNSIDHLFQVIQGLCSRIRSTPNVHKFRDELETLELHVESTQTNGDVQK